MKNFLEIGKIVKPQGIKGEVKLLPYVDELQPFFKLKSAFLDGKEIKIVGVRINGSDVFLLLDGVNDRNDAEALRNKVLSLPIDQSRPFAGDGYFISDLLECSVIVEGEVLGVIKNVLKCGSADVLEVKGDKNFSLPFLKKVTKSIDIEKKTIEFDKSAFLEVVLYED